MAKLPPDHRTALRLPRMRPLRRPWVVEKPKTKGLLDRLASRAENSPSFRLWVRLNQSLPLIALVVAIFAAGYAYKKYVADESKAEEDRVAAAWDVVTRMSGRMSNGGQIEAVKLLHRRKIPLRNVDLHGTYLRGLPLVGGDLSEANLEESNLAEAD